MSSRLFLLSLAVVFVASPAREMNGFSTEGLENENKIPDELRAILEKTEQFELLSLSPATQKDEIKDSFHGWKILGKTTVKDAETRKKVVAAFKKGVEDNKGGPAFCFNPRHGIRISHDGKTTDLVVCFECSQVQVFVGNELIWSFWPENSPANTFDEVLKAAKVPLAEMPKK